LPEAASIVSFNVSINLISFALLQLLV